jgi:alcohol dehydrogenase class IV
MRAGDAVVPVAGITFELAAPARVVFRAGAVAEVAAAARDAGGHALLVTGRSPERAGAVTRQLADAGVRWTVFSVAGEPTLDTARAGVAAARDAGCDLVIGFGGGSALDAAKAIAALVANGGDPLDYLEVIGNGRPLTRPSLPTIAIPTTAGTGSEVTKNAVLAAPDQGVKASLRSPLMLPRLAIVDPDLLAGAPASVLAASGLDALSQVIEPLLSIRANPATDALAREGIRRSAAALPRAHAAVRAGRPIEAADREALALASVLGGLCLANAGLGAVHGFAAPIGGMFVAPHGAVCAALLPAVLRVNARALAARAPDSAALARCHELAPMLTGNPDASLDDGLTWMTSLCRSLDIPGLAHYGVTRAHVPELVAKARAASSMKANPLPLAEDELAEIALESL